MEALQLPPVRLSKAKLEDPLQQTKSMPITGEWDSKGLSKRQAANARLSWHLRLAKSMGNRRGGGGGGYKLHHKHRFSKVEGAAVVKRMTCRFSFIGQKGMRARAF